MKIGQSTENRTYSYFLGVKDNVEGKMVTRNNKPLRNALVDYIPPKEIGNRFTLLTISNFSWGLTNKLRKKI